MFMAASVIPRASLSRPQCSSFITSLSVSQETFFSVPLHQLDIDEPFLSLDYRPTASVLAGFRDDFISEW
jgi:hypothetical protein